jgi:hypothetical protein
MLRKGFVVGFLVCSLVACNENSTCPSGDPSCNPFGLLFYGCPTGSFHSYFGPENSTGTAIFPTAVYGTSGGGYLVAGRAPSSFGQPIRDFTVSGVNEDQFVLRADTLGRISWNTFLGSAQNEPGDLPVRVREGNGRVYVHGSGAAAFGDNGDFPYQGTAKNWALSLLTPAGSLTATHFFGGPLVAQSKDVVIAANGDLILVGDLGAGFSGSTGTNLIPYSGTGSNGVVMRLSADGRPRWNTFMGGGGATTFDGFDVAESPDGSIYALLDGNGALPAAAFPNPANSPAGAEDAVVVKLDANGLYQRHAFAGSTLTDKSRSLVVLADGNVVVAMTTDVSFGSPIVPHSNPTVQHDVALVQFDAELNVKWVTFFETGRTTANDYMDLAALPEGGFMLTVSAEGSTGSPVVPFNGTTDVALVRYNADGIRRDHAYVGGAGVTTFGISGVPTCDGGFVTTGIATGSFGRPTAQFPAGSTFGGFIAKVGADLRLAQ